MEPTKEDNHLNSTDIKYGGKSPFTESTIEQTECLSDITSVAEQISTEDTELSLSDVSAIAVRTSEVTVKCDVKKKPEGGVTRAVSCNSLYSVEKEQPKPLYALLPSATCTIQHTLEASQVRSQDSLKTTTVHSIPPDEADTCAALLLACLFCQPLDCLLATVRGCNVCVCWFCSSLCGCEATALQPLLDMSPQCELWGCLGSHCCLCDCPICDICLQATECLDLAMEISQMLYH